MFENDIFETWLDGKARELVDKIGRGDSLSSEEMIILVLKAQSNHFSHLDVELRDDMKLLREDTSRDMQQLREDISRDMQQLREDTARDMKLLREDMDKRFEQVDKRFEQVDKRFEQLLGRMDKFMIWSLGATLSSTLFILGFLKLSL